LSAESTALEALLAAGLGPLVTTRSDTLTQQVYRALRLAMFKGQLDPGRLYSENWTAQILDASRTPVREALRQLEFEGLVEIIPQRGFRLRILSAGEVREFYTLREMLESYVVTSLCETATDGSLDSSIGSLHRILERQRDCVNDPPDFVAWDEEFHLAVAALANLPRAARMIASLRGILWLLGTRIIGNHERREAVLEEHSRIVEALLAHDCAASTAAMKAHIRETARLAMATPLGYERQVGSRRTDTAVDWTAPSTVRGRTANDRRERASGNRGQGGGLQ